MNLELAVAHLRATGEWIEAAYRGMPPDVGTHRPGPEKWSLVEILGHLVDEERDDFGTRLRLIVADPALDWPPNDPVRNVRERRHQEKPAAALLADFVAARAETLAWLRTLDDEALKTVKHDPRGSLAAGDLLAAWVAHDLAHLAQMARTRLSAWKALAAPYSVDYAF